MFIHEFTVAAETVRMSIYSYMYNYAGHACIHANFRMIYNYTRNTGLVHKDRYIDSNISYVYHENNYLFHIRESGGMSVFKIDRESFPLSRREGFWDL